MNIYFKCFPSAVKQSQVVLLFLNTAFPNILVFILDASKPSADFTVHTDTKLFPKNQKLPRLKLLSHLMLIVNCFEVVFNSKARTRPSLFLLFSSVSRFDGLLAWTLVFS